ncbi:MAG: MerR family transcriptional regulator [Prevotella sp.]
MVLNLNKNLKLYYSISEVAKMFDVNESTLRYWEKEFPSLKPKTSGPSLTRQYTDKDIEKIKQIHNLIKVRGFKISSARKILNSNPTGTEKTTEVIDRLINIKNELQLMKKQLDGTFA